MHWSGRLAAALFAAGVAFSISACSSTGEFCILGYRAGSLHAREYRTIRVPIFKNETFVRGIEFQLTEALIKQIELKTPWKVVRDEAAADTELTGRIVVVAKRVIFPSPLNEIREGEVQLGVEVVWRDLRSGEILSNPLDPAREAVVPVPLLRDPLDPPPPPVAVPVLVQRTASFIPELGESTATVRQEVVRDLAEQIVSMMEVSPFAGCPADAGELPLP
jgi:hypothetical protein